MRRRLADLNPLVRGFLVIALIVAVVYVLQLEQTLTALYLILRIVFFLAIAVVVYLFWRDRRSEIGTWSRRSQAVLYGGAAVIVANVGLRFFVPASRGLDLLSFLLVFALCGFAMWRVWRDEHTYG
jgi:uncharacterized membrane protein